MNKSDVKTIKNLLIDAFDATAVEEELLDLKQGRYRFGVVASKFIRMSHLKRQDKIWEVIDKAVQAKKISREAMLEISLILAYAPEELEQPA